jgi:hypothetical protein
MHLGHLLALVAAVELLRSAVTQVLGLVAMAALALHQALLVPALRGLVVAAVLEQEQTALVVLAVAAVLLYLDQQTQAAVLVVDQPELLAAAAPVLSSSKFPTPSPLHSLAV